MSHNLIVLSELPDKIIFPSDEKFIDLTGCVCDLIVFTFMSVPGYHNLIVLSKEALARILALGEKETDETGF